MTDDTEILEAALPALYPEQLEDIQTAFDPGTINLENADDLQELATKFAARYSGLVVTETTEKSSRATSKELNGVIKSLDAKRKEMKALYQQPLTKFEAQVKSITEPLTEARSGIKDGLEKLAAKRLAERQQMIQTLVQAAAERHGLDAGEITIDPRWSNVSFGEMKRMRAIEQAAADAEQGKRFHEEQNQKVIAFAEKLHLEASGWLHTLDLYGYDTDRVFNEMQQAAEEKEQQARAALVDKDTGEIVNVTRTLTLTGTPDDVEQAIQAAKAVLSGYFVTVKEEAR
ncbi:DUF1351 domain-containing protein [Lacticaseibacillus songhuajiangensis]|uniref:DUF1351 domain-containing protein n=1 Tax=Lacticaseibacillus songhuajiangensis TaxID=1296539 RepID=UPI000F7A00F6|nr:DUF1351 domain-containing protein [Lacticaseibacillus songhuajiangensis]